MKTIHVSRRGGKTAYTVAQIQEYLTHGAIAHAQCRVSRKGPIWRTLRIHAIKQQKEGTMGQLGNGRWCLLSGVIQIYEQTRLAL